MTLFYYQDQNALSKCFLIQIFPLSHGNKEKNGKISQTIEATNGILVLVVKWHHHANGLLDLKIRYCGTCTLAFRSHGIVDKLHGALDVF